MSATSVASQAKAAPESAGISMPRLARDLVTFAVGRAVPVAGSMVFTLLCVQLLPPSTYARYSLSVLPALVAAAFAGGLAGQPLLRFGLHLDASGRRKALWTIPLTCGTVALPLIATWTAWRGESLLYAAAAFPLVPLIAMTDARRSYLVALSRPGNVFWLDTFRTALGLGFLVLLSLVARGTVPSPLAPLAALSLGTFSALVLVRTTNPASTVHESVKVDRHYLHYGLWTAGWLAVATVMPLAERLLLERSHGLEAAGIYAAISDPLTSAVSAGTSIIGYTLWPTFIVAWTKRDTPLVRRLTALGLSGSIGMGVLVGLLGICVATLPAGRLSALLRNEAILAFTMLGVTTLWAACVIVHKPLELTKNTRSMFFCILAALILFVPLAFLLARPFGGVGIVAAKGIAGFFYLAAVSFVSGGANRSRD